MILDYRFILAAVVGVSLALCYAPRFLIHRGTELTRNQLIEAHPELVWLRVDNVADVAWFFGLLVLYGLAFFLLPSRVELLYLIATFPAAMGVNRALLTIWTGLGQIPYRFSFYRYIYTNRTNQIKAVGWIQLLGAFGLIGGILLAMGLH